MLRSILAIIASYAVMFVFFFAAFTGCYVALGADRVFQSDSYEVSMLWIVLALVLSLLGSILGGYICAVISRNMRTCQVFAFIVFLLGLLACIPAMKRNPDSPNVRAGEVENLQAMQLAVTPLWVHLFTPVISAIGVLAGARIKGRGNAA
jgi:ABC-type antimicrobial peptide transport system permease subunit